MAGNRKKAEAFILDIMGRATKNGFNRTVYEKLFGDMNDKQFEQFVVALEQGKRLAIWFTDHSPNDMPVYENMLNLCREVGVELEQQLVIFDEDTGVKTMTAHKAIVGVVEARNQREMLNKKISVAKDDSMIDDLTGQVMGESRATGISQPEITVLRGLGLTIMANELYNVKGGDQAALRAYKNDILTMGHTTTNGSLKKGEIPKVLSTVYYLLRGRMLDNNFNVRY